MSHGEMQQPKICAVCGVTLDELWDQGESQGWMHTQEFVGQGDHVAIPVDYDDALITAMCDFCYDEIPLDQRLVVPAENFVMPFGAGQSMGNWTACQECGVLIRRRRWSQLIVRATDGFMNSQFQTSMQRGEIRKHITAMYERLQVHMTGSVRDWETGDEMSVRE